VISFETYELVRWAASDGFAQEGGQPQMDPPRKLNHQFISNGGLLFGYMREQIENSDRWNQLGFNFFHWLGC